MNRQQREQKKMALLAMIQQQRQDLVASRDLWLHSTARYDRGWEVLLGLRHYLMLGAGVMAIGILRRPRPLLRWGKRALGLWSSWRLLRNSLLHR